MDNDLKIQIIATIRNNYASKFGIPRQSGLADIPSVIIFEPEFRIPEAVRGLKDFSHIWLLWLFSQNHNASWSPTVRPPRLGGNTRLGVFATRSPYRPNPLGLSCVKLHSVDHHPEFGDTLTVYGADLMDGTPIIDIKPDIPYADSHPDAVGGFAASGSPQKLTVRFDPSLKISDQEQQELKEVLSNDPRPAYQNDAERLYGINFGKKNVRFSISNGQLTVKEITSI